MSQMIPFNPNENASLPAHLQGASLNVSQGLLAVAGMGGNRIGLKGSRFRLVVSGKEEAVLDTLYMDVIVLGVVPHYSRVYYEGTYRQGENARPTCYSETGISPAEDIEKPQSNKCEMCPQNQKGSKIVDGVKMKACGYFQRLIVALADDPEFRTFKLDVKSQGLFGASQENVHKYNLRDYAKFISNRNADVATLITRISFDTTSSVPKLLFHPAGYIDADQFERVREAVASEEVKSMLKINMATIDLSGESKADEEGESAHAETPTPPAATSRPAPEAPKPTPAKPVEEPKKHYRGVPEKLGDFTPQQYLESGWTKEMLLEQGYIVEVTPEPPKPVAPPKPPAPPVPKPAAPPAPPAAVQVESVPIPTRTAPAPKPAAPTQHAVQETTSDAELEAIIGELQ